MTPEGHFKDMVLDDLAARGNVAQFVSFGPDLEQRYGRVRGLEPGHRFPSLKVAVETLLSLAPDGSVNIRSFHPQHSKSREFVYGLTEAEEIVTKVRSLAADGLTTIVNETVDIEDGGVSGVAFGDVLEFAPKDIPRCVEKPGTAALPRAMGLRLLEVVYGFSPTLPESPDLRVEWSIHPLRRGTRHGHTILWEVEEAGAPPATPEVLWPNRFSRFLGDKCYGLLVAHLVDLPVPMTLAIPREVAPFSFGESTGLQEVWIRTCPPEQVAGKYSTAHGWMDPYRLLQSEDPEGKEIASVLCQSAVSPIHSGKLLTQADGALLTEGVSGRGDKFMKGEQAAEDLPDEALAGVGRLYHRALTALGPVQMEWVFDGEAAWVVQLHRGTSLTQGRTIYPGAFTEARIFETGDGIEALRRLVDEVHGTGTGIILRGRIGVTSHLGDILRRARIPSRLEDPPVQA